MKVIIAIDSFKGSLSSTEGSKAVAAGIREIYPSANIEIVPLADGGEGTVDAIIAACGGVRRTVAVTGPLMEPIHATYGVLSDGKTAVIETAAVCGLPLVPFDKRNPMITTSYGLGEMIADAVFQGCRHFIIGLGGSATNDAGIGMLQALGFRFQDQSGDSAYIGGQSLLHVHAADAGGLLPELKECTFTIACDVRIDLYGSEGAAYIFAPQKGADPSMVKLLDHGLRRFAAFCLSELGVQINGFPGAGAAGGLGGAFTGFLNGRLQSGAGLILELAKFEEKLKDANFVISGEGRLDGQTQMGKAPLGVAEIARKHGVPVLGLAGTVTEEASVLNSNGFTSLFSIIRSPITLDEAMKKEQAMKGLRETTVQLFRLIRAIERQ
ncbi:glycerate kinase (plasmid) [Paenibacillus rhizovicinus]|uniref:Glycerate kinase n=1 Tax=Paenibacillus rhizovicinus TaxID=2704463 RepID=A0A6C0PAI3_9BACL|nr:glycerate kinase [Paenibacillus rhizovicinus]QHW35538.1 glycerate kinase [Paenibacillus rhizovicinus]